MEAETQDKLLEVMKTMNDDIRKLKKENLIIKYIIKKMWNISVDDLYKEK